MKDRIFYLCNKTPHQETCHSSNSPCNGTNGFLFCKHTANIEFAKNYKSPPLDDEINKNFELLGNDILNGYFEIEALEVIE